MKRRFAVTRRRFLKAAAGVTVAGLGTGFYAWRLEPHWLEVVEHDLPLSHLAEGWVGKRLVQLSDLHIGPRVDDGYLIDTFRRVDAMAPDIVVYTGDFTTYAPDNVEHARRMFAHLPHGRRATVGVLGNHDYALGWHDPDAGDAMAAMLRAEGVQVLRNELTSVDGLQIVGMDDLWARQFKPRQALAALDARRAALVLSHNPDTADRPGWDGFKSWILAGHTHGGQCKPPFLPAPLLPVRNRRYTAGAFALSGRRSMYINRGVGHLTRVRFNARPEVTMFNLVRDALVDIAR